MARRAVRSVTTADHLSTTVGCRHTAPARAAQERPAAADPLQRAVDGVVAAGAPAALLEIRDASDTRSYTAGRADLATGRPVRPADRFRIASVTKMFTATVVLQLVAEHRLGLDDPVERTLPGLVPDGGHITIRGLLNHTSGLPDYHLYDGIDSAAAYKTRRFDDPSARQSLALAFAHPNLFPPGTAFSYTDTNYLVLGLVIQKITGHSASAEISRRLLHPLALRHTTYPVHDPTIRGPHLDGYMPSDLPGQPYADTDHPIDYTTELVDQTGAAGAMISTTDDVLEFSRALLGGRLLPPYLTRAMSADPVPPGDEPTLPGYVGSGLGLEVYDFGCGTMGGHTGLIRGYTTITVSSLDGRRQLALVMSVNPPAQATVSAAAQVVSAFCRSAQE